MRPTRGSHASPFHPSLDVERPILGEGPAVDVEADVVLRDLQPVLAVVRGDVDGDVEDVAGVVDPDGDERPDEEAVRLAEALKGPPGAPDAVRGRACEHGGLGYVGDEVAVREGPYSLQVGRPGREWVGVYYRSSECENSEGEHE